MREFYAVRAKHWGIGEEAYPEPIIEQLPQGVVSGRRLLVVDEVADTGKTLAAVVRELERAGAAEVRSAVLHVKPSTEFMPDYYVVRLREWAWIFYPWSLVETVFSLASAGGSGGDAVAERAVELARSLVRDDVPEDVLLTGLRAYVIRSSRPSP